MATAKEHITEVVGLTLYDFGDVFLGGSHLVSPVIVLVDIIAEACHYRQYFARGTSDAVNPHLNPLPEGEEEIQPQIYADTRGFRKAARADVKLRLTLSV